MVTDRRNISSPPPRMSDGVAPRRSLSVEPDAQDLEQIIVSPNSLPTPPKCVCTYGEEDPGYPLL